jgi:Tfp pilus assembly protein PilV
MRTHQTAQANHRKIRGLSLVRACTEERAAGRRTDSGVTLIEVVVAFAVLMIALVPLSYLFTTSLIQAGQATNQQTALSVAEKWAEVLSNVTPPVNPATGAVVTDTNSAPAGPAPSSSSGTIASASNNKAFNSVSSVTVTTTATFQATTAAPQTIQINTGTVALPVIDTITYSSVTPSGSTTIFTCASNPCSASTDTTSTGDTVNQTSIVTPTETRGNTLYRLNAMYSWATAQNSGTGTQPNLCTAGTPQLLKLKVTVSWGPNADANNVQTSEMINYPPAGVQTLGFIALQLTGDLTGIDTQSPPAAWSSRVQAVSVSLTGAEALTSLHPDSYGCVFAQVEPGSYTVTVSPATTNVPLGTNYTNPSFVANSVGTSYNASNVLIPTTQEQNPSTTPVVVNIGAVTRVQGSTASSYFPGYDQGTNINLSYPSTTAVEDGVYCPGAGQITCISSGENGSGAVVTWTNGGTWSNATLPVGTPVTRVASITCPGTTVCFGVGYGSGGAVILRGSTGVSPALTADSVPANTASLTQIVCPSSTTCVAIGTNASGVGVVVTLATIGATSALDSWASAPIATTTSLTSLVCPSSATGCVALATTTTANQPVIVSGPVTGGAWVTGTFTGFTVSALTQVACPTTTTCLAIGTGKVGSATSPVVLAGVVGGSGLSGIVAWTADTLVGTPTLGSLSQIVCPTSAKCLVTGTGTSGALSGALVLYPSTTAGQLNIEFPPGTGSTVVSVISQVSCPSSTTCTVIGTSPGGPVILNLAVQGTTAADTWAAEALPSGYGSVNALTDVVCPSNTACLISATGTGVVNNAPRAFLLYTTNGGSSWSEVGWPSTDNILYFDDIDCSSGSSGTCSAVGATPSGAVFLTSGNGPGGTSGSWVDLTPTTGLSGLYTTGVPIAMSNTGLLPNVNATAVLAGGAAADATAIPDLYPFAGGYTMWAGDCQAEGAASYATVLPTTQPGGSTNITVPLGQLSILVAHATGTPVGLPISGATLKLVASTTGCSADTYNLQSTGSDGLSRTEVPFGTYNLSVTVSGVTTSAGSVVVGANSVSLTNGTTTTSVLPTPLAVSV